MDIYTYIPIDPSIHRPNLLCIEDAANISLNGFEDCSRCWRQNIAQASRPYCAAVNDKSRFCWTSERMFFPPAKVTDLAWAEGRLHRIRALRVTTAAFSQDQ